MVKRTILSLTEENVRMLDKLVIKHGFASRSDFVRYAIRFWHEKSTGSGGSVSERGDKEDRKYEQIEDIIGLNIPEDNLKKLLDD